MITGPLACLDLDAVPTVTTDGDGHSLTTYPPLAGVFGITDRATFARSADVLTPYRVTPVPAQHVLGGDDPAAPTLTVTLKFPDQATFAAVVGPVNALPPVPAPLSSPAPQPPAGRTLSVYDFLLRFPTAKRLAIRGAIPTDPIIADFMDLLNHVGGESGPMVNLDDPNLQAGVGYLESRGYVTADEALAILA